MPIETEELSVQNVSMHQTALRLEFLQKNWGIIWWQQFGLPNKTFHRVLCFELWHWWDSVNKISKRDVDRTHAQQLLIVPNHFTWTGELGYDRLNGTRKIGPSYAKSVLYILQYLICIGLGPSISSVIYKNLSYSGPSYPSLPVYEQN